MAKRKRPGDVLAIPLGGGDFAYARLHRESVLGIYAGRYRSISELPADAPYFRMLCVYASDLAALETVSHRPFADEAESWYPDFAVADAVTGRKYGRYHRGEILPCAAEECEGLEICAVWTVSHITDMLCGDTKWDDSITPHTGKDG